MLIHLTDGEPGQLVAISFSLKNPALLRLAHRFPDVISGAEVYRNVVEAAMAGTPQTSPGLTLRLSVELNGQAVLLVAPAKGAAFCLPAALVNEALKLSFLHLTTIEEATTTPTELDEVLGRILDSGL